MVVSLVAYFFWPTLYIAAFIHTEWSRKEMHEVLCTVISQPFTVESRAFHQKKKRKDHCLLVNTKFILVNIPW